jgi:2,4-dienoyl-CoA reductase-like NADH-dependent reductase (Old Yellow Enzyme family)
MSALFTPLDLGAVRLANRIVVSPMCQYSADDGCATDWHLQHLPALGLGGAGLVMTEATHVERRGRITHGCLGLYSDANEFALARALAVARRFAPAGTRFGIQLAHSGRKGAVARPWEGGGPLPAHADAWDTVAPSAIPFKAGWPVPTALDEAGIERVVVAFVDAARRAARIGADVVELHAGHGYLLHQFLSPLANARTDRWGGSAEGRARLTLVVAERVRAELPASVALGVRLTTTDWADGGVSTEDAVDVARALRALGAAYVCATGGFVVPPVAIPFGPGYQVHLAERVRREAGIATRAVGGITDPHHAEAIVAEGRADMVALATAFLADPRWAWRAADALGADVAYPPQYARAKAARRPPSRRSL